MPMEKQHQNKGKKDAMPNAFLIQKLLILRQATFFDDDQIFVTIIENKPRDILFRHARQLCTKQTLQLQ